MPKTRSNNSQVITFDSEAELQFALNQATLPDRWNVLAKGGKFTAVGTGGGQFISPEAEEVLANMPTPLAGAERDAVINFLNSQSEILGSGNWSFVDAFAHGKLSNALNKLWKWKQNDAMINNGAVLGVDGWVFNGVDAYIDSNYNPAVDAVNYQLNDAIFGHFFIDADGSDFISGSLSTGRTYFRLLGGVRRLAINGGNDQAEELTKDYDGLNIISRIVSTNLSLWENGIEGSNVISSSTQFPTANYYIGAQNNGSAAITFYNGKISSVIIGGAIGFDQLDFYNNLAILNDAL